MTTRRDTLKLGLAAAASLALPSSIVRAAAGDLITRAIPSSGERIPAVGLGSSATFSQVARSEDVSALREVMAAMLEHGGTVLDTAPSYGESERVVGDIARESGQTNQVFWATKLNVAGRGGGSADPDWVIANPPLSLGLTVFGDRLLAHGNFSSIAGANRQSLAAFPVVEYFGRSGFE